MRGGGLEDRVAGVGEGRRVPATRTKVRLLARGACWMRWGITRESTTRQVVGFEHVGGRLAGEARRCPQESHERVRDNDELAGSRAVTAVEMGSQLLPSGGWLEARRWR